MSSADFVPTIGIECHVQLKTKTKLFAAVGNDARQAAPNTLISHICVAMPGALPVLNEAAIELCARAALALGTEPQKLSHFERKHYFYPDLPKGYQITQYKSPIIAGGHLHIEVDGQKKCVSIERANLEEDAGKNTHPAGADYSLVDLNRAGTPLLEIVSMPDIHSAAEAKAFARELWLTMKYAGVTDGDLYHGHVRFDLNISVSSDPDKLGTRSEIKNLNSFRSVEAAVDYEIKRQTELLKKGEKIVQETRGWDEAKQKRISQRSKEEAEDYRYMPEPDVPPVELADEYIKEIEKTMPDLPSTIRMKLKEIKVDPKVIEDILTSQDTAETVIKILNDAGAKHAKRAAFLILWKSGDLAPGLTATPIGQLIGYKRIIKLSELVEDGVLSSTASKDVFYEMIEDKSDPQDIAKKLKIIQVSNEDEIKKIVVEVIKENPKVAEDIKAGHEKAIGFLVGQVMAKTKGQANPGLAQQLIKKQLGR